MFEQSSALHLVEEMNSILEEVIVEIFVNVQQKVESNLFWVHNFLQIYLYFRDISIIIYRLDESVAVPPGQVVIRRIAAAFPFFLSYDLLSFVIHIVNRSLEDGSFIVAECMENRYIAHSEAIDQLIIVGETIFDLKDEFRFS
jgi:hypothetical protein